MAKTVSEIVTEKIIEQMEKGIIPWKKGWTGCPDGAYNRVSKKPYSFLNQLLLMKPGEWASYKQWTDLGGKLKEGESKKYSIAVFYKPNVHKEKDEDGNEIEKFGRPILRYYKLWHIDQIDGVEPLEIPTREFNPIEEAENRIKFYVDKSGVGFEHHAGDRAYYSILEDLVVLPKREQFDSSEEYYETAFHEFTHSTMKADRCNRWSEQKYANFGSEKYSKEELVAEIGSAMTLQVLGIENQIENATAYIQSWLSVLKNDKNFILEAANKAQKAFDYMFDGYEVV